MNQNIVAEYQKLCSIVCSPQSSEEKNTSEQIIYESLSDWANLPSVYFILSSSDEVTLFVTFEYLNRIVMSDKGFANFPEKSSNFSWKEDGDQGKAFEGSAYKQIFEFLLEMMTTRTGVKEFIRNSLCNLISQILRKAWNEHGALGSVLESIFGTLGRNVR